jgi:hypothetical protein
MKKRAVIVAAMISLAATWPNVSEWGPGGTLNGATSPAYSFPITVLDSIRATVQAGEKRQAWTRIRNAALEDWALPFNVVNAPNLPVTDPGWYPPTDTIALVRSQTYLGVDPGPGFRVAEGAWIADSQSGIVILSLNNWLKWQDLWQSFVGHEVGHAIGFGHPNSGSEAVPNRWIMGGGYHPADDEIAAAQTYYGTNAS